jgi:glycosyltransferase involved in cell wall biosynthesis
LLHQLGMSPPDFILFSSGTSLDGLDLLESIAASKIPYGVVTHLVSTDHWPDDATAEKMIRLFSGARRFWAVSHHNLELLETQLAHRLSHARIARNPFLVSGAPTPMPGDVNSSLVKFAIPARLHPRTKGHDILLRVLSQKKWKDRHWEASIFGSGAHGVRLKALASMLGIDEKVRFCGQTSDIHSLWGNHHALLLPSRHEGLPLTLVEAMWAGRVVIAQPAGGIAELLNDGQTGFLAEGIGEKFFDEVLERAWSQRARWKEIASAAAEHVRTVIPEAPEKIFAQELLELAQSSPPQD